MTDAEVMTTAIIASLRFRGSLELSRHSLQDAGNIPHMLGKSRFNRHLHRIQNLFLTLFHLLGETWKGLNRQFVYVLDSCPIAACDNYRLCHSINCRNHGQNARTFAAKIHSSHYSRTTG